jgi:Lrp/AsnC family transcriptional regulator of ectoine degradation
MKNTSLDSIDIRILSAIQKHGQLSKTKLSEMVDLSPTPCWARLAKLKAAGYIRGYHAEIELSLIGDLTKVIVMVALSSHRQTDFDRFETHIQNVDEITECISTGGGMDYVLKIYCPRLANFQQLMESLLNAELSIDRYMTYIVTREIKSTQPNLRKLIGKR